MTASRAIERTEKSSRSRFWRQRVVERSKLDCSRAECLEPVDRVESMAVSGIRGSTELATRSRREERNEVKLCESRGQNESALKRIVGVDMSLNRVDMSVERRRRSSRRETGRNGESDAVLDHELIRLWDATCSFDRQQSPCACDWL